SGRALLGRGLIEPFAPHEMERRLVVKLEVVEGVGENLGHPHEPGLHVADEEQMNSAEQEPGKTEEEPDLRDVANVAGRTAMRLEQAEQGRIEIEGERRERPDGQQHGLAPEIIADLDVFLVLV